MLEGLDLLNTLLPVLVTLATLLAVKGVGLLKKLVLKTETKVDDALVDAILKKLKELD
jgi:hypothetical protein